MVLGFKKQFCIPIIGGGKIHTIREDKHNRWKAGRSIQFATGVRTNNYKQFFKGECISVQKVEIKYRTINGRRIDIPDVYVDGKEIMLSGIAANDGFSSIQDFLKWFDKDFEGKIIHWTDVKY